MDLPHTNRTGLHAQSFGAESHGCGFVESPADAAMFGRRTGRKANPAGTPQGLRCKSTQKYLRTSVDGSAANSNWQVGT